jgi:hypothetical protein
MPPSVSGSTVCEPLAALLGSHGFSRKAFLFSRRSEDLLHLVQLQGSNTNTRTSSKFTVNVGVWVPGLAPGKLPAISAAHWRQRLGFLCPEHQDIWWQVEQQSAPTVARDIAARVERYALPSLASLPNSKSLLALWQRGSSPGLTRVQASRFTDLLAASVA